MRVLLALSCLAAASAASLPQLFPPPLVRYAPSAVYRYRYTAPHQTKQEEADALGGVRGSYSVAYPEAGGLLTQTYSFPGRPVVLRTADNGPLGPAGTLVTLKNSKLSTFLIEMLEQQLDSRSPPVLTYTDAVLVESVPVFTNSKVSAALIDLRVESEASGGAREQELQLRDPGDAVVVDAAPADPADVPAGPAPQFVNSKESEALRVLRVQSLNDLTPREPPIIGPEEIIVEAAADDGAIARRA